MTEKKTKQFLNRHRRMPGDKFPPKSGNQVIVRKCLDEIQVLRDFGFERSAVCELITEIFNHDKGLLTPERLSACITAITKNDSKRATALREERVSKLKGNMEQILQNLRMKSAFYHGDLSALIHSTPATPMPVVQAKPKTVPVATANPESQAFESYKPPTILPGSRSWHVNEWTKKFFLMKGGPRQSGKEQDFVKHYIDEHLKELLVLEEQTKDGLIKKMKEVFGNYQEQEKQKQQQ